jgi:N-hydroxyarylamine O-acetyltransferase
LGHTTELSSSAPAQIDSAGYLQRIGYSGQTEPTAETLRQLHRAHLLAVPFENLNIALKRKIVVDPEVTVRKIAEQKRGGFCYELNGAFATLLETLGFKVSLLSARVAREDGSFGRDFDHLTLRVDLEAPWLADVGFGDCFIEPLRLLHPGEQEQIGRIFRIGELGDGLLLEEKIGSNWKNHYRFTLQPRQMGEFADMCHFHQTSPESNFTRNSVCTRATPEGRITVTATKLVITRNGKKEERPLADREERDRILEEQFGIVLRAG